MSNSNRDFIADVMSGDETQNSNPVTYRNYDLSDDEETVVASENTTLSNLLSESENVVRSLSNLSAYKTSAVEDQKFERKPWQSLHSIRPFHNAYSMSTTTGRSVGTSDYVSDELLLPPSARTHASDSRSRLYCNQNQVQTFSDTTTLLQTLKDELVARTSELHQTENEYFNVKANFENLNGRFEHSQIELSSLRSQVNSKDKQIKILTEKVGRLNADVSLSQEGCQVTKAEHNKIREKLEQCDRIADQKIDSLSREIKKRDEVIEQLRSELSEKADNNRANRATDHTDGQLKEKITQFESAIRTKEQKILAQQRQLAEYEHEISELKQANIQESDSKSEVEHMHHEMELLKEQLDNARVKNDAINETLTNSKRFYDEFKDTSEKSMQDYVRITQKLKTDYRELEDKHRESLTTMKQRGDCNKRLNDDIKELTNKLKTLENLLVEKDKSIHSLNLENIENQQKIESLRSQLVEGSISETNTNLSYKKDIENKQAYIEQLSKETVQLNRCINELKDKLSFRDGTIDQLNSKIVELDSWRCANQKSIQNLEENVYQLSYREKKLEESNKDNENKVQLLQLECKNVKEQYESARNEVNKILSEKRDLERDLQRKEERLLEENNSRSYETDNLRMELNKVNQMLVIEQESSRHAASEMEKLLKEYNKLNIDFMKLSEGAEDKEVMYNELSEKEQRLISHNGYLEEELTKMKLAYEDTCEELEKVRKSWDSREDTLAICKEESLRQKANNLELISKIEQRDQLLQRLTTETGKLKHKYQNKATELSRLNDQNIRLKESLSYVESSMTGVNQKYEEMKTKKEKEINQLKIELEELQSQYSNCYDELIQKQEFSVKCQATEKESALKITQLHHEMSQQQLDYDEMEAELNIIRAKYRACQEELSRRDEELIILRSDVQNFQQDILSFQSERHTFQKEIDRSRDKFSELQEKFKQHQLQSDSMEDNISTKDHTIEELHSNLQVSKQENTNQLRIMEQLKAELELAKSTNNDRSNHFQSIIESLKAEIETKNKESRFLEENCSKYRQDIGRLKSEQENLNQSLLVDNEHLDNLKSKLQTKEDECQHWIQQCQSAQYLNEEVKISLDSLESELSQLKQQACTKDSQIRSQVEAVTKLRNEKNEHYKHLTDCQRQLESISRDKAEVERSFEENVLKMKKYEKCIRDLNEELSQAQIEMSTLSNKNARLESELSQSLMLTSHKHSMIETLECKLAKIKLNTNKYKSTHKSDDTEVENLNGLLLQQTKKCADLENMLYCKSKDNELMSVEIEKRDKELLGCKEILVEMKKEIDNLHQEREEKCCQLEELQKKYQHEMKKLKSYSRQVEDDMVALQSTIDELQRQLDDKDLQLDKAVQRSEFIDEELDRRKKEIVTLEQRLRECEIDKRHYESINSVELCRQSGLQKDLEQLQNENKEFRSLVVELTDRRAKVETKCSTLELLLEKSDKKVMQSETKMKTMQSSFYAYSKELEELRQQHQNQSITLDKTKDEYKRFTDEYNVLRAEKMSEGRTSTAMGCEIDTLKSEVMNHVENVNMLKEQVEQQEALIIELQDALIEEQKKVLDLQNNDYHKKRALSELENDSDVLTRSREELKVKLREKERIANACQTENDNLNIKIRDMKTIIIDRDNRIKLLEKRIQSAKEETKQMSQSLAQIDANGTPTQLLSDRSDYVDQLESRLTDNQEQLDRLRSELRQSNSKNYELSLDRQMLDEDIQRLKEEKMDLQSKLTSFTLNYEGSHAVTNARQTQYLADENESLQRTVKKLRYELQEKDQLLFKNHDDSSTNLALKLSHKPGQERDNENRIKQLMFDLESKSKEVVTLKQINEKIIREIESITSEVDRSGIEIKTLQSQNSTIMDNFNTWIKEQKVANEKLGERIRDQNKTIQELKKEKEVWQRGRGNISTKHKQDRDRDLPYKTLLQNELGSAEEIIQVKNKVIEELQGEVNDLKSELTRLQQQSLISKNNHKMLKIELDRAFSANESCANVQSGPTGRRTTKNEALDANGSDGTDKQYWIERVGELTDELQQCRDYWSNKVRELTNIADCTSSSVISIDTLTQISS